MSVLEREVDPRSRSNRALSPLLVDFPRAPPRLLETEESDETEEAVYKEEQAQHRVLRRCRGREKKGGRKGRSSSLLECPPTPRWTSSSSSSSLCLRRQNRVSIPPLTPINMQKRTSYLDLEDWDEELSEGMLLRRKEGKWSEETFET